MNTLFAITGLIIAIMALTMDRVKLILKIVITSFIAKYVYILAFGEFTFILTDEAIAKFNWQQYFGNEFQQAIIAFASVWLLYSFLLPFIIRKCTEKKLLKFYSGYIQKIGNRQFKAMMLKIGKKIVRRINVNNDKPINYNEISSDFYKFISTILQVMTFWLIFVSNGRIVDIILIIFVSLLMITIIIITPLYKYALEDFNKLTSHEHNRNI